MQLVCLLCCSMPWIQSKSEAIDQFDHTLFDWTSTWAHVAQQAKEKHYHIDSIEKAMAAGIDAFVSSLDPHSNFLDQKAYESMIESTNGEFCGIGIMINNMRTNKDKFLSVIDIIPEGPACKAGVRPNDKIIQIDDQILDDMSTSEAIKLLKGKKGTTVTIHIMREGSSEIIKAVITRDIVKEQQSTCFYIRDKKIYYISLSTFAHNSAEQLEKLLVKAQKSNPKGIIIDLRNNSGGLLSSVIDIAGLFLEQGSLVVTTKNNKGAITNTYPTKRKPVLQPGLIITILINNFTASAAEILAGTMKAHADHTKKGIPPLFAFIIGTPSFGKGSVQEVMPIGNNCALKLTTSLYFLPYDTPVQGVGIEPDITIERSIPLPDQSKWTIDHFGREANLPNYIGNNQKKELSKKTSKNEESWIERVKKNLSDDNQLKEAINVTCLIHYGKTNLPDIITNRTNALLFLKHHHVCNDQLALEEIKL